MTEDYVLTDAQNKWAKRRSRQSASKVLQIKLLEEQRGLCALSRVPLTFDPIDGTPQVGGLGCHPLYPAIDHIDPGNVSGGFQIICYALNDLKGHMPTGCFNALTRTDEWKELMQMWKTQAEVDPNDRQAFKRLLRPNVTPKIKGRGATD